MRMATKPRGTLQTLWPEPASTAEQEPDRLLLDAIAAGALDHHLVAIADAVHARRELLHTVRAANAISQLCVGDHVRFNHQVRPRYLEHEHGLITEIDDRWVAVRLWRPVGRFRNGELRCPPLALDE
jgi:hypothetical protein